MHPLIKYLCKFRDVLGIEERSGPLDQVPLSLEVLMEPESTVGRFGSLGRPSACLVEAFLKQWVTGDADVHHTSGFLFLPFVAFAHGEDLSFVENAARNVSGLLQLA